jgi:HD-GYP domain-containing protein (c-di-GMP phosphodiesterase class II)
MDGRRRFLSGRSPPASRPRSEHRGDALAEVELEMSCALSYALELRETTVQVQEHSLRVMRLACAIAELVAVGEGDLQSLRKGATLHEIGMVAVPPELLTRASGLSREELERVRSHAKIGAEIVRATHGTATARLVERQYDDYFALRRATLDSRELLLAGILRVADVYDAMTAPRPYQRPAPAEDKQLVLRGGSGSKFHPAAVHALLHLLRSSASAKGPPAR